MASFVVSRPDVFPDGTTVGAYPRALSKFPLPGAAHAPIGAADATVVIAGGTGTLTGLADGTRYEMVGLVGSEYRRLYVRTAEVGTGLAASAVVPSWRARRRQLGLV